MKNTMNSILTVARRCSLRLVSLIYSLKWWQVAVTVMMLSLYHNSAIVLRVNHVGLVIKHTDTWMPEFRTKSELLSD